MNNTTPIGFMFISIFMSLPLALLTATFSTVVFFLLTKTKLKIKPIWLVLISVLISSIVSIQLWSAMEMLGTLLTSHKTRVHVVEDYGQSQEKEFIEPILK